VNATKQIAMLILVSLAACTKPPEDVVFYCGPDGGASGRMRIDFDTLTVSGVDSSSMMDPFSISGFVGIRNPYPILVFEPSIDPKTLSESMSAAGYIFTFQSLESEVRDWWVITARPNPDAMAPGRTPTNLTSTVLYSPSDGVLAISTSPLGEGRTFSSNYVPCGPKALSYADLYTAAQSVAPQ
jgi:hypothetical protein